MSTDLFNNDCLTVLRPMPPACIDAIITDLPYGITSNKWDSVIPLPEMWEQFLRVGKQNAVFIFTASQPFTSTLVMSKPELFKHEWIWIKNAGSNFANTMREPMKEHESVLVFSRGKWTYNRQMQERAESGKSRVKTAVKFETSSDNYREFEGRDAKIMPELRVPSSWQKFNRERGLHPTQKPLALMKYLVETYTNPNDLVFDGCMGSGTTGVACVELGRNFIGVEIEKAYCDIARTRISDAEMGSLI